MELMLTRLGSPISAVGHSVQSHRGVGWSVGEAVMMGITVDKGQDCPAPTSALCNAGQISGAWSELPNTVAKHSILHTAVCCLLFAVSHFLLP